MQSEYRFDEDPARRIYTVNVTRGLEQDGFTKIGSVAKPAFVDYQLMDDTAINGDDFRGQNGLSRGTLSFAANEREALLNIEIVDDTDPELEESFKVRKISPFQDSMRQKLSQLSLGL